MQRRGAMLLEVVLSLVILFTTAGVVVGALNLSTRQVQRLQREARAVDLAVTVLSELQIGLLPVAGDGPNPFDPDVPGWTWQTVVEDTTDVVVTGSTLQQVTVIVREDESGYTFRLATLMPETPEEGL